MVLAGVASFSLAVSTAWQNAGNSQAVLLSANHDAMLLAERIRPCVLTGGWQAGSIDGSASTGAAVLLWKGDTNPDGDVDYSEIMLIQHDPVKHQLDLYQAPVPLQIADYVCSYAHVFSQAAFVSTFKGSLTPTILCSNVTGAEFYVGSTSSATSMPFVEFALTVKSGTNSQIVYGDATLRSPLPVPAN